MKSVSHIVLESKVAPLEALTARLKPEMDQVNALILSRMQSDIPLIPALAGHLIAAGGKRIRPLLTLASAALFGYDGGRQYRLSACVEFIHTATLLHDDVVDASDQRRGRASANALFGNEAAVLVGDFLFSRAFQLMVEDGSLDVLRILSTASAVIAEGEVLQLSTAKNIETTEAQYLQVIQSKTAALFAAACEVGAVVAGRPEGDCRAMREYGLALGIAFQMADDAMDYAATARQMGKMPGDDFREGKMTLPLIKAIAEATPAEKEFWAQCLSAEGGPSDQDFARALEILTHHRAIEKTLEAARLASLKGKAALEHLPHHPVRDELSALLDFVVNRDA